MKPIGKYIIITEIQEELKTSSGLLLSNEDANNFRYKKGLVKKVGRDVTPVIKAEDTIYFDKAAGHQMFINDESYTVILERDVVVVI
tara:strand:- start:1184 stop:1444 length:261 start_codon:yes stop_codon:yes gene_type:complete